MADEEDAGTPAGTAAAGTPAAGMAALYLPILGGRTIAIAVDERRVASVHTHSVTGVGGRGQLMVLIDRYASRAEPGTPCAAGEEVYVRLIDPVAERERWHMLAHSCLDGIVAADPIVTFDPDGGGFAVDRVDAPPVRVAFDAWLGEAPGEPPAASVADE